MSYANHSKLDPFLPFPADASKAEIIAHQADEQGVCDWTFRRKILDHLPDRFAVPVAERYYSIHQAQGRANGNEYAEPKGYEIIGVEMGSVMIPTRIHQWVVKSSPNCTQVNVIYKMNLLGHR